MSTNFYFNNFPSRLGDVSSVTPEQLLVENLVIEALQIYGMDAYYLPRTTRDEVDYLFGEDALKEYRNAYPVEMYLENVTGMDGDGAFMSKFGLEIRDEITLLVSRLRFRYNVPGYTRPREGDLVYVPMVTTLFEVTHVEHEKDQAMFYTLGRGRGGNVYVYALKLKQYVFSSEIVQTGIAEIDNNMRAYYPRTRISLSGGGTGSFLKDEIVYQGANVAYANSQAFVYEFLPNVHIDVYRIQGDFKSNVAIKGESSNANWTISIVSDVSTQNNAFEDIIDNARIEAASDSIIDFTEQNPFGEP